MVYTHTHGGLRVSLIITVNTLLHNKTDDYLNLFSFRDKHIGLRCQVVILALLYLWTQEHICKMPIPLHRKKRTKILNKIVFVFSWVIRNIKLHRQTRTLANAHDRQTRTLANAHTNTHTLSLTHTHSHTLTHSHSHTHTLTLTHTHTRRACCSQRHSLT